MNVRVRAFAAAAEVLGSRELNVDAHRLDNLLAHLHSLAGEGASVIAKCAIVLNDEVINRSPLALADGDEVALLPPVSGGQDISMIDVAERIETVREATAACTLYVDPLVRDRLLAGDVPKGDAVSTAQVAGMLAAKKTPELLPMCHPVRTTKVAISITPAGTDGIEIRATVRGRDRTGFEMEALVAASTAALTLHDMGKSEDPAMRVDGLRVIRKAGGRGGDWEQE